MKRCTAPTVAAVLAAIGCSACGIIGIGDDDPAVAASIGEDIIRAMNEANKMAVTLRDITRAPNILRDMISFTAPRLPGVSLVESSSTMRFPEILKGITFHYDSVAVVIPGTGDQWNPGTRPGAHPDGLRFLLYNMGRIPPVVLTPLFELGWLEFVVREVTYDEEQGPLPYETVVAVLVGDTVLKAELLSSDFHGDIDWGLRAVSEDLPSGDPHPFGDFYLQSRSTGERWNFAASGSFRGEARTSLVNVLRPNGGNWVFQFRTDPSFPEFFDGNMDLAITGLADVDWRLTYKAPFDSEGIITGDDIPGVEIECDGGSEQCSGVLACIQGDVLAPMFTEPSRGCAQFSLVEYGPIEIEGVDFVTLSTLYQSIREINDFILSLVQPLGVADVRLPRSCLETGFC